MRIAISIAVLLLSEGCRAVWGPFTFFVPAGERPARRSLTSRDVSIASARDDSYVVVGKVLVQRNRCAPAAWDDETIAAARDEAADQGCDTVVLGPVTPNCSFRLSKSHHDDTVYEAECLARK